jgi:hypothetical protein
VNRLGKQFAKFNYRADNQDNIVFKYLFGDGIRNKLDIKTRNCMEGSYIVADDLNYRPPRPIIVNDMTQANFLIAGEEIDGTRGHYEY